MKRYLEQGFTLVELMVVVAIIGILSAVAIPNFKKYQAKSKTTEAKMQLASVYSYELTAASEYDTFTGCLSTLGYDAAPKGYYLIGFSSQFGTASAVANGLAGCTGAAAIGVTAFTPVALKSYSVTVTSANLPSGMTGDQDSFTAGAAANLNGSAIDQWSINEQKNLVQNNAGY